MRKSILSVSTNAMSLAVSLFFVFSIMIILALAFVSTVTVYASQVSVSINGQPVTFPDQGAAIVNGRTLVPVAGVFQALGFSSEWSAATQQVVLRRAGDLIVINIGSRSFTFNGTIHSLDVPAQIIGGRTMLPIAPVLRSVGYSVDWDNQNRIVVITTGSGNQPAAPTVGAGIDVLGLFGLDFNATRHLFGNIVFRDYGYGISYIFDTGIGVGYGSGIIDRFFVDYSEVADLTAFNLGGIDGTSSRSDVRARFGVPDTTRNNGNTGTIDYGYQVAGGLYGGPFVWFAFDNNGRVVSFSYFFGVRHF